MSCCGCSTIEGESELSTDKGTKQPPNIYPYTGAGNILLLCTGTMTRHLVVEQHSTQNRLVLNCPYRANIALTPVTHQRRCTTFLKSPLARSKFFISANVTLPQPLRSLKLMEYVPVGQSMPLAHYPKK